MLREGKKALAAVRGSGTPTRDTSCRRRPLTDVRYLRFGPTQGDLHRATQVLEAGTAAVNCIKQRIATDMMAKSGQAQRDR